MYQRMELQIQSKNSDYLFRLIMSDNFKHYVYVPTYVIIIIITRIFVYIRILLHGHNYII